MFFIVVFFTVDKLLLQGFYNKELFSLHLLQMFKIKSENKTCAISTFSGFVSPFVQAENQ